MAWITPVEADVLSEFTPAEAASLQAVQAATDNLPTILTRTIAEIRGFIRAGSYTLDPNSVTTIPDALYEDALAIARWRFLISMPQLAKLQTKFREEAFTWAQSKLKLIAAQKFAIEEPDGAGNTPPPTPTVPAGSWNSENKLIMRSHPVPTPGTQLPPPTDGMPDPYANPSAPEDQT